MHFRRALESQVKRFFAHKSPHRVAAIAHWALFSPQTCSSASDRGRRKGEETSRRSSDCAHAVLTDYLERRWLRIGREAPGHAGCKCIQTCNTHFPSPCGSRVDRDSRIALHVACLVKKIISSSRTLAQLTTFHDPPRPHQPPSQDVRGHTARLRSTQGPNQPQDGVLGRMADFNPPPGYDPNVTTLDFDQPNEPSRRTSLSSNVTTRASNQLPADDSVRRVRRRPGFSRSKWASTSGRSLKTRRHATLVDDCAKKEDESGTHKFGKLTAPTRKETCRP